MDLRVILALMEAGLDRRRDDAEGEEEGDMIDCFKRAALGEAEEGSWMILSRLTNTPCFSLHLKYNVPLTEPLCLP